MGFVVEASHHEVAPGQHEIDIKYGEAMDAADNIMTFKLAVKTLAQRNGLHATFMPKPLSGKSGSGMHINMSLFKGEKNLFYDAMAGNTACPGGLWLYRRYYGAHQGHHCYHQPAGQLL